MMIIKVLGASPLSRTYSGAQLWQRQVCQQQLGAQLSTISLSPLFLHIEHQDLAKISEIAKNKCSRN